MKKNIVIHYPFIAKYRIPIFKKLSLDKDFNIVFWASEKGTNKFLLTDTDGLNIKNTPIKLISIPFLRNKFEWQPSAIKNILTNDVDFYIVLGNPNSLSTWLCLFIANIRNIQIFIWSHGYLSNETGIKGLIRKFFYKLANKHLLYGNKAKEIMLKKGFSNKELYVIYNSLDYEKQKNYREKLKYDDRLAIRRKFNFSEKSITFVTIGRLVKKFKLEQMIEVIKIMTEKGIDTNLIIIGDGEEKESLIKLAKNFKVENKVVFYGACHEEREISLLYNASDFSVVMGSVGLAAMHSLAYGVPMITNDNMSKHHPEIEAVVEGSTGFYFEENNLMDFISKVKNLEYRGEIYQNCIKTIENYYTPEVQYNLIKSVLNDSLEEKHEN